MRYLVELIEPEIKEETDDNNALSPSMQVLLTLRFLATGTFQRMLGDDVGVARTTVGRKVYKCIQAIAALRPQFIKFPETRQEIAETKRDFHDIAGFPGGVYIFPERKKQTFQFFGAFVSIVVVLFEGPYRWCLRKISNGKSPTI